MAACTGAWQKMRPERCSAGMRRCRYQVSEPAPVPLIRGTGFGMPKLRSAGSIAGDAGKNGAKGNGERKIMRAIKPVAMIYSIE